MAALLALGMGSVSADPVEIHDDERAMVQRAACAVWAEPIVVEDQPTRYRRVIACVTVSDDDGDGTADWRAGHVGSATCDSESGNGFCSSSQTIGSSVVDASGADVDIEAGTARLHADLGTCRVELDWVATGGISAQSADGPHTVERSTTPLDVSLVRRSSAQRSRVASVTGSLCPAASTTDTAPEAGMYEESYGLRRTGVTVDPAS